MKTKSINRRFRSFNLLRRLGDPIHATFLVASYWLPSFSGKQTWAKMVLLKPVPAVKIQQQSMP